MMALVCLAFTAFFVDVALCQLPTYRNIGMNDVVFQHSLLFDQPVRSLLECAARCSQDDRCVTFTRILQPSGDASCRGHSAEMDSTSPVTSLELAKAKTFVMTDTRGKKEIDPCDPESYTTLDNPERNVYNMMVANFGDNNLTAGWYRFELNGQIAMIPNESRTKYHCSSKAPLWLNAEGQSFPGPGNEVNVTACAGQAGSCYISLPLIVHNCGNTFLVYYLVPTENVNAQYCAVPFP